uniref:Ubiquitin-like protease family profile domain-containing protein n=1 Tax=Brassica oleracea var. oleracea TaxID=109376 RepID=A0A0D3CWU0_BRAOL
MTSTPTPSATGRLTKRMDIPELPRRLYTSGEEPEAHNSISYHTDNSKLHTALRKALTDDEFEELKESSLGVFIKFKEQGFGWASRLVHYMLSFKLDIKKKYEMWSLVGPEPLRFSLLEFENLTGLNCEYIEDLETPKCDVTPEMVSFWGMLGVHLEAGPTTDQIIAALKRCGDWSREDRKRLAYLSIFTGFIEGRKFSTATRSTLARLVMDLERFENYPWGRVAFKVLMDSLWNKEIAGCYTVDGFIQVLQSRQSVSTDTGLRGQQRPQINESCYLESDAWDAIMEHFLRMVPYLLVECAATNEIRVKYGLEPYTYERPLKGVPTANNGDCGVYAVKYIECHALGVSFDPKDFARCNAKKMRDNMAVDIWKELVDQHLKENVDGDKFVGIFSGLSKSAPFGLYENLVRERFGFYRVRVGVSKSSKNWYNPMYFRVRVPIRSLV